jgi:hypothetical protein
VPSDNAVKAGTRHVVTLFADHGFTGRSLELDMGEHRLFATDFNDAVSSIRVPNALGALAYEHADNAGGFG